MNYYIIVDITTGRRIGWLEAKSLHAAKCLAPRRFGYNRFARVYLAESV